MEAYGTSLRFLYVVDKGTVSTLYSNIFNRCRPYSDAMVTFGTNSFCEPPTSFHQSKGQYCMLVLEQSSTVPHMINYTLPDVNYGHCYNHNQYEHTHRQNNNHYCKTKRYNSNQYIHVRGIFKIYKYTFVTITESSIAIVFIRSKK